MIEKKFKTKSNNSKNILRKIRYGLFDRNFRYLTSPFRALPKFIIVGSVRSGTTSLYYNICEHPEIAPAAYDEIGFFDVNFNLGLNWYRSMFPLKSDKNITGEDTPFYFWREDAAKRIKKILPNIKLIMILRNPIDRAYSNYHLGVRGGTEKLSFEEAIQIEIETLEKIDINKNNLVELCSKPRSYVIKSMYYEQMKIWIENFSMENLFILSTENMSKNPNEELKKIFEFLNVSPFKITNPQNRKSAQYDIMKDSTREKLLEFFRPHNKKLFELIEQDFKWNF